MPFFPQAYLSPEANFLSLLAELDAPQHESQKACGPRGRCNPQRQQTFTPRFDVTETEQAYELFGELAGLEQKDLEIEFSDAQTLVIKGQTERSASTTGAVATPAPAAQEPETSSKKSHDATVEDEYDETDTPLAATPATTATATSSPQEEQKVEAPKAEPKAKLWVSERRVGSFARSFSFSQRIEQDGVQASLKNGVLHLVVPKSVKSRRVAVSVL